MTDWFEWRGEDFYAIRGEDLYYCGCVLKRMGVDRWDAWAHGQRPGVFTSELAARRRVELVVTGRHCLASRRPASGARSVPSAQRAIGRAGSSTVDQMRTFNIIKAKAERKHAWMLGNPCMQVLIIGVL